MYVRSRKLAVLVACVLALQASQLQAEAIKVRHIEGVALGFLVLRTLDGKPMAYGQLKQVVHPETGIVTDDLSFRFKDGSYFQEITKFTQNGEFRLVSDQVVEKGPLFKQETESWIDAATGKVTIRTAHHGKERVTTKQLDLPRDVSNGLLFTILKNVDPSAPETIVSMVAASANPRVVELHISPAREKVFKVGPVRYKAQHFVVKVKIKGVAGTIAPLVGKQPPDVHVWIAKSEAPTFIESEGPLSQDTPVWRIEMASPDPEVPTPKNTTSR